MKQNQTLAELSETNRERAKHDLRLAYTTYPELLYPIFLRPCVVHILVVTDAGGSFDNAAFGLAELLSVLAISPGPFVRFAVTKAHRGAVAANADISSFRFDTTDLSQFDEIWMFAVSRGGVSPISEAELRAISQFMNAGGGVFATGDHEDLGVDMCGRIPRVRSMRKWHWPNPGPNGEPVAPKVDGPTRLDTNRVGSNTSIEFEDQSDDMPQEIYPKLYYSPSPFFFRRTVYPHPLMCGPGGRLRYMPDHPHEGECYVPSDLTASFTFGGFTIAEYPTLPSGAALAPEVVARAHTGPGLTSKGSAPPATFGTVGAYDGHQVGVGRVVTDATWHHFFNINTRGDPSAGIPDQQLGFYGSAAGLAKYEDIKTYYRNIAVWLARPERHQCMRWRAIWATRWDHRIAMDLRPTPFAELNLGELLRIGGVARDVLGRIAWQCQSYQWILDWFKHLRVIERIRPWPPLPPDPPPFELDPAGVFLGHALVDGTLGAVLYALRERFPEPTDDARKAAEGSEREVLEAATGLATRLVGEAARQFQERSEEFVRTLR
jgi:hypothetical protein